MRSSRRIRSCDEPPFALAIRPWQPGCIRTSSLSSPHAPPSSPSRSPPPHSPFPRRQSSRRTSSSRSTRRRSALPQVQLSLPRSCQCSPPPSGKPAGCTKRASGSAQRCSRLYGEANSSGPRRRYRLSLASRWTNWCSTTSASLGASHCGTSGSSVALLTRTCDRRPLTLPIRFAIRNLSATATFSYHLSLASPSTRGVTLAGALTHKGEVCPLALASVQARLWIPRAGVLQAGAYTLTLSWTEGATGTVQKVVLQGAARDIRVREAGRASAPSAPPPALAPPVPLVDTLA